MHYVFVVVDILIDFGKDLGPEPERDITLAGVRIKGFAGYVSASVLENLKIPVS